MYKLTTVNNNIIIEIILFYNTTAHFSLNSKHQRCSYSMNWYQVGNLVGLKPIKVYVIKTGIFRASEGLI